MRLALVCFYCLCVFVYVLYFIATMSFAGYFLPVLFCMLSMLISDSRLIWFGSVYLVTTAGFVADQLMWENNNKTTTTTCRLRRLTVWSLIFLFYFSFLFQFSRVCWLFWVLLFLFDFFHNVYPFWVVSLWPRKAFASVGPVRMLESTE